MQKYHDEPRQYKGYLKNALVRRSQVRQDSLRTAVVLDADEDGDPDIILPNETAGIAGGWENGYRRVVLGWRNRGV